MRRQVRPQPLFLRRPGLATANRYTIAVNYNDVPTAQIIAVIAGRWITPRRAEVTKISGGIQGRVVMVARRRTRPREMTPPGGVVAIRKLARRPEVVHIIPQGENCAGDSIKQLGSRLIA